MNRKTPFLISTFLSFILLAAASADVFAARMGGGRSFGSRPSYNAPYQRSPSQVSPGSARPAMPGQQPAMSAAQQRNQSMRDSLAQRGGFGRFLGGMALGGLLGAMFMGGGFEHINFFDILIFAGLAFLLMKFLAARRQSAERVATPAGGLYGVDQTADTDTVYGRQSTERRQDRAGFDTDILSRKGGASLQSSSHAVSIPADFDAPSFLNGAKAAYEMMQKAWDQGDLADLRALTSDKVFGELQDQIRARGGAVNRTDLLKVDVELLEVREAGADREATVLFDVLMRETPEAKPAQVREVWHFTRPRNSRQPTWLLDGIQQLED